MRLNDQRYNAIPLANAPSVDTRVAYVATRSPQRQYARWQQAERKKKRT